MRRGVEMNRDHMQDRRQHQQDFVGLHRGEVEQQPRGFMIEKRRINGLLSWLRPPEITSEIPLGPQD